MKTIKTIIVTRHPGALDWIQKHHPEIGDVRIITQAAPKDLAGNRIIGILPVNLAALCGEYWSLDMEIPLEFRGKELMCEDMERFGCSIKRWVVVDPTRNGFKCPFYTPEGYSGGCVCPDPSENPGW